MSTSFFDLDRVRLDRFVRLDLTTGQLVAPLHKGQKIWPTVPLIKRRVLAVVHTYNLGSVTLNSTSAYAVFKVGTTPAWTIDTAHFSGKPKLKLVVNAAKDHFTLRLRDARFPGTEVPADFTAVIQKVDGVWNLAVSFLWGGFQASVDLAAWLSKPLQSPLVSTLLKPGEVCAFAGDKRLVLGPQPSAVFLPTWGFLVSGNARFEGLTSQALVNTVFAINVLTPEMPGLLKQLNRRRTLLMLGNPWSAPWFSLPLEGDSATDWRIRAPASCFSTLQMEFAEDAHNDKTARLLTAYSLHPDPTLLHFAPGADLRNDLGDRLLVPVLRPATLQFYAHQASTPLLAVVGTLGWKSGWVHTASTSIQLGAPQRTGFVLVRNGATTLVGHPLTILQGRSGLAFRLQATAVRSSAVDLLAQPTAAPLRSLAVLQVGAAGGEPLVPAADDPLRIELDGSAAARIDFPRDWASFMVRPADLMVLLLRFKNLRLHSHGNEVPQLRREGNQAGRLVVYFPPQSLAEETPLEAQVLLPQYRAPIRVRLAGLSRLAFSTTQSKLALDRDTLLGWVHEPGQAASSVWTPSITPTAKQPREDGDPGPAEDDETSIEAPYGLFVSGNQHGAWHGWQSAPLYNDRNELWHVNLRSELRGNPVLKAFDHRHTNPFELPLLVSERQAIVGNSISKGFEAERFMLSPLGAWMNVEGKWDAELENWRNLTTMGRDHYVKTVKRGILLPFGHRAVFISISERKLLDKIGGYKEARLQKRLFILVREPVLDFSQVAEDASVKAESLGFHSRQLPFKSVRIVTVKTTDLAAPSASPLSSSPLCQPPETAFWPMVDTGAGLQDFQFLVRAEDRAGHTLEWMMPMAFVRARRMGADEANPENDVSSYAAFLSAAMGHSGGAQLLHTHNDSADPLFDAASPNPRLISPLHGQALSLVPASSSNQDAAVNAAALAFRVAIEHRPDDVYPYRLVNPVLADAQLSVPVLRQLGQLTTPQRATYASAYLRDGYAPANKGEIFMRFVRSVNLSFGGSNRPDKVGGVVSPGMAIGGLSRLIGPVGVKTEAGSTEVSDSHLATLAGGSFDPMQYFADALNAKLLGGVTLQEILQTVSFSAAALSGGNAVVPAWTSVREGNSTCYQLDWHTSALTSNSVFQTTTSPTLSLSVRARVSDTGAAESTVSGKLTSFKLVLAGVIAIDFGSFEFTVPAGGKPLVHVQVPGIEFQGALKFINAVSGVLGLNHFSDPPYLDITSEGLLCGYTLRIPTIAVGAFALQNLALDASIGLPFTGAPARARLAVSKRHDPFLLTVSLYTGGGFFAIEAASDNTRIVEGSLEFGASIALNLGVASGGVYVMAGIYFRIETNACKLSGYVRAGGSLEVLGLITVSVEFYLELNYEDPVVWGQASMTVKVEVLFFSSSVTLTVRREFAGGSRDLPFDEMISLPEWDNYLAAFAD